MILRPPGREGLVGAASAFATMIRCNSCDRYNETRFTALRTCPRCGSDLVARVAAHRKMEVKRHAGNIAHAYELQYSDAPLVDVAIDLRHEKEQLLAYAYCMVDVADRVRRWVTSKDDFVIGFMTGSAPLTALLRQLYPTMLDGRLQLVPGLAHAGHGARPALERVLGDYFARGMRRLFVIDEANSGTQLHTAAQAIERWAHRVARTATLPVHLLGLRDASRSKPEHEIRTLVAGAKRHNGRRVTRIQLTLLTAPRLLAYDHYGDLIKGVRRHPESYLPSRIRVRSYEVHCSRSVHTPCAPLLGASAGAADQQFGNVLLRVVGKQKSAASSWPDAALCKPCEALLRQVRGLVERLEPDWPDVSAIDLGKYWDVRARAQKQLVIPRS